ncbi:MAG: hypothetical protein ACYTDE_09490 [Planctomycetota bacterium]|jgi:hypothetical protein
MRLGILAAVALAVAATTGSHAAVTEFMSIEEWSSAAGTYTEIGFTEFPDLTEIVDQYRDQGVLFPGLDVIQGPAPVAFPIDGFGLSSVEGLIDMEFLDPISAFAIHFPGFTNIRMWSGDTVIGEVIDVGGGGGGNFIGFTFDVPVTRVEMIEPFPPGDVNIDQLYFTVIPGPAALPLLAIGLLRGRRRR